jgi:hypothetical protein
MYDSDYENEELEPRVRYTFIVTEEDYEDEDLQEPRPWDASEIFFRIEY